MRRFCLVCLVMTGLVGCGKGTPAAQSMNAAVTDSDGDGIVDSDDACTEGPYDPSKTNAVGCPDQDMDGVRDRDDQCESTPKDTPVGDTGCPLNDPRDGFGDESYSPRIAPQADRDRIVELYLNIGWPADCEDDHIAPPAPRAIIPAIWSVEFSIPWSSGAMVEIAFTEVPDSCQPVTYGIEVQRRDGNEWVTAANERRLAQPVLAVPWPSNVWGRYRAFARDNNGLASAETPWRYFTFASMDVPPADHFVPPPGRGPWQP